MADTPRPVAPLQTKDGQPFDIPAEGALGLMAIGYKGLMLWRAKRAAVGLKPGQTLHDQKKVPGISSPLGPKKG